ncbi:receptor-like protein 34 [Eucalyptus grandis]|uniref:receptor-like protein 34 n=1 Tax=Eucalyptus grandis TaxID=71139 RepID=UPI00192ECB96|nr:receptor-like protein 34 [Eucalyptus grandis]
MGTMIQRLTKLEHLDLSWLNVSAPFLEAIANLSSLTSLVLKGCNLQGTIPTAIFELPRELLNLCFNSELSGEPEVGDQFLKLRIVDLSMNNFSSSLPYEYFNIWSAMKVHDSYDGYYYGVSEITYNPIFLHGEERLRDDDQVRYHYSMTIINKSIGLEYEKILGYLNVIDISSNNFIGEIPNSIGSLIELRLLNISNNYLTSPIPSSLANLIKLESFNLSSNKLSGMIPLALTHLIFLAFFNVLDNHLSGPIPQANQFTTFENNSYGGNFGLCGGPLTKKCRNPVETPFAPPSSAFAEEDSRTWFEELDWKIVLIGFGGGLVIDVVMGLTTTSRIERWFLRFYRGMQGRPMHQIRFV